MEGEQANSEQAAKGPDLAQGVAESELADGAMVAGHVGGEPVLLVRRGDECFAVGATCTHYGAPLADGLLVGDSVRCPWHHAAFCLRTGQALRAPALSPLQCWQVERRDGRIHVSGKSPPPQPATRRLASAASAPARVIVIVGGGCAGTAAALALRDAGWDGTITMYSADPQPPCDRPNLSKSYLDGSAPVDYVPLHPPEFYSEQRIGLRLDATVEAIDVKARRLRLADCSEQPFDALLLATGATPVQLTIPGAELPHVHYLRTWSDCDALIAAAASARRVVIIGASFIGLEAAASLRKRGLEVHVVGREKTLMERVLGPEVGRFLQRLHEQHGVVFHLGTTPTAIDAGRVTLSDGRTLEAELVLAGIGARPALELAQRAGLAMDRGVTVDAYLQTSAPGIYAAGDIARWPDPLSGEAIRVEHWVVAGRQGQAAARNMIGAKEPFQAVPFFWTEQYDFGLAYVGHAERFDKVLIDGDLEARDCRISYQQGGRTLAQAFVHRDLDGLKAERAFEQMLAGEALT